MALLDDLVSVYFGRTAAPASLEVGLTRQGSEVVDGGYSRFVVERGAWTVDSSGASVHVRFGPFGDEVRFDSLVLIRGGKVIDRFPFGRVHTVPAGVGFESDAVVAV